MAAVQMIAPGWNFAHLRTRIRHTSCWFLILSPLSAFPFSRISEPATHIPEMIVRRHPDLSFSPIRVVFRDSRQNLLHLGEVSGLDQMVIEPRRLRLLTVALLPIPSHGDQYDVL